MSEEGLPAGIHRLEIPTPFAIGAVNSYLIEGEPLTLVDTGPNSGKGLDALGAGLEALGHSIEAIELVLVTHNHIDHIGLVEIVVERSGAAVGALGIAAERLADFDSERRREDEFAVELMLRNGIPADVATALRSVSDSFHEWGSHVEVTRPLADGDRIDIGERELEVLFRPGHSPMDTVFWDAEARVLLAGDHLLAAVSSNPLLARPLDGSPGRTRSLVAYIDSLKRTRELPARAVLGGHGETIADHRTLIDNRLAGIDRRKEKIYRLIAEGEPRNGYELANAIWGNVAVTQAFLTLSEVIGSIDLLADEGRVQEIEDGAVVRYAAT